MGLRAVEIRFNLYGPWPDRRILDAKLREPLVSIECGPQRCSSMHICKWDRQSPPRNLAARYSGTMREPGTIQSLPISAVTKRSLRTHAPSEAEFLTYGMTRVNSPLTGPWAHRSWRAEGVPRMISSNCLVSSRAA